MKKFYGEISKSEQLDDGTIKVWGYASSDSVDSDGETITAEALKNAIPDYMKFGAVREMHGSSAAGTAIEATVLENGKTWFGALIVDPVAVLKIKTGTYKGFSIGGNVIKRNKTNKSIIEEIKLIEVSLVDRPANPEAVFEVFKADKLDNSNKIEDNIKNKDKNMENKEVIKTEVAESIKEVKVEDKIEKGLSDVAWLASLLQELNWLQSCLSNESAYEKDNSPIPAELATIIKSLGDTLVNLVKEEVSEIATNLTEEVIELSEKTNDLNKAGSRHSAADFSKIKQIYDLTKELGAVDSEEAVAEKSESIEDLKKFETVNEELAKSLKINEELTKRVKELESMPAANKSVLFSINKNEDSNSSIENKDVIYKSNSNEIDEVATAIKKAQKGIK